mgnify:CR=1 FL=1
MKLKKIYLEITNICNLNCSFCIGNERTKKFMPFEEFKIILRKIKKHTNYLYFHILGEPLMHPNINEFINYAHDEGFNVNITTNGYLINNIKNNPNIRQLNISLHSFNGNINVNKYLNNIFDTVDILTQNKTYISLRLWVQNKYHQEMINFIKEKFKIRQCKNFKYKDRACLNYHIKKCLAPCMNYVSPEEYRKQIEQIMMLLEGKTDIIIQRFLEIWESLPQLFILIIVASVFAPGFWLLLLIMLFFGWPALVGVVRTEFLRTRNFEFVKAAKALGVNDVS